MKTRSPITVVVTAVLGLGALPPGAAAQSRPVRRRGAAVLAAMPAVFAFGRVPINGGNVGTKFVVTNVAGRPVRLLRVYTSCGCTTASLTFSDGTRVGPFGMPGHDLPIQYDRTVTPGEQFEVEAVFDPAAHGPAGLGSVSRGIILETADGPPLEFGFTAEVVPPARR